MNLRVRSRAKRGVSNHGHGLRAILRGSLRSRLRMRREAMQFIRTALIALALLGAGQAHAQNYPDRTIRLIVGFTPGSATDISARMFAQKLSESWNVAVTVENI